MRPGNTTKKRSGESIFVIKHRVCGFFFSDLKMYTVSSDVIFQNCTDARGASRLKVKFPAAAEETTPESALSGLIYLIKSTGISSGIPLFRRYVREMALGNSVVQLLLERFPREGPRVGKLTGREERSDERECVAVSSQRKGFWF